MNKVICVFLFNKEGEMLLQLRAKDEASYPLHWDFSASGSVETEDATIDDAAAREMLEEIGIKTALTPTGQDHFQDEQIYLYTGEYSEKFHPGPEVERVMFASIDTVKKMIANGEKFHPEFLYVFNKMY